MINELHPLSCAMKRAQIIAQSWHRKYKPIPNISNKAPCIRVILSNGSINEINTIDRELGSHLRKYGSNQGTFPCCNLVPLYRVTDDEIKKELHELINGIFDKLDTLRIQTWCTNSNWSKKFCLKYAISMEAVPNELLSILKGDLSYVPMSILLEEAAHFKDPKTLHSALEKSALKMLEQRTDVSLALQILFHAGNDEKPAEEDTGSLSVAFDCRKLIDDEAPVVSDRFTREFNHVLLEADSSEKDSEKPIAIDAFELPFTPLEEPMPTVKLPGGFEVTLRTMFGAVRCQTRYGRTDNASYPISPGLRLELQAALGWLGDSERKYKTWINTDKNEILFAYPHMLPKTNAQFVRAFKRVPDSATVFEKEAEALIADLQGLHPHGAQAHAERLSVFILRKIDKARTKVIYTRVTDPNELKHRANEWARGCENLPVLPFGRPPTPFPVDIADTLNRAWKQGGTVATEKFKTVPHYRGMQLLMEADEPVTQDLALLTQSCVNLASHLGTLSVTDRSHTKTIWQCVREMVSLCGLMLYRQDERKEHYMENYSYRYGQFLKISDEIHVLYCLVVRKGEVPPQLAGGGLVQAATEAPIRTLNLLRQRTMPYINWAKSYRYQGVTDDGKESWRAGWLMNLYEATATMLSSVWTPQTRLNDSEKAQLFLGYIAALPKKDKPAGQAKDDTDKANVEKIETEGN